MKLNKTDIVVQVLSHIILALFIITALFPLVWMGTGAFKTYGEIMDMPPRLFPNTVNMNNFLELRKYFNVERFLLNSIIVSIATMVLQIVISIMAAFAFAKMSFKGKNALFMLYMTTMMIPFQIYMTALFRIFVGLNLKDNLIAVILPGTFSMFGIFLARQHIMTIPDSYIEVGLLDGASYFRILFSIIVPFCKPVIAAIAVFAFMNSWNQFIWPLIIIDSTDRMILTLGLSRVHGMYKTEYNLLMTGNLIIFIPMFIVYLFAQKFFSKSIALSGLKG